MKAWLLKEFGDLDAMHLTETETPEPAPGEVLIKLEFAALNPADRYLAQKLYPARPEFPHILGRDGCGTVAKTGEGVNDFQPGDRVTILRGDAGVDKPGTLAEYVSIPSDRLARSPESWKPEESACAALVYLTAHQALTQWEPLERESVVVITGATGGVGVASLQLALSMGLRVIGLSRSQEKGAQLQKWGAEAVFDPSEEDLKQKIRALAGKAGVSLIVDNVGGPGLPTLIDTLGMHGRVSVVGMLAGPIPKFNTAKLFFKRLRIGGVSAGTYTSEEARRTWEEIVQTLDIVGRRPAIDSIHPMEDAIKAFHRMAEGPLGKVLIKISE